LRSEAQSAEESNPQFLLHLSQLHEEILWSDILPPHSTHRIVEGSFATLKSMREIKDERRNFDIVPS
jgi:hypothetical protein